MLVQVIKEKFALSHYWINKLAEVDESIGGALVGLIVAAAAATATVTVAATAAAAAATVAAAAVAATVAATIALPSRRSWLFSSFSVDGSFVIVHAEHQQSR